MKETYERAKIDIFELQTEDVIMTSGEPIDPMKPKARYMVPIR